MATCARSFRRQRTPTLVCEIAQTASDRLPKVPRHSASDGPSLDNRYRRAQPLWARLMSLGLHANLRGSVSEETLTQVAEPR